MHDADSFGDYYESAIQLPVSLPGAGVSGAYSPYLYLGSDGAVAVGREIYGQPKKGGQPRLEARGDLWVGTVSRNGIDVLTATLPYKHRRADPAGLAQFGDFRTNLNLKVITGVDGRIAIRQLTARQFENVRIHECWSGPATVELRPNAQAPVYRLPVREMLTASTGAPTSSCPMAAWCTITWPPKEARDVSGTSSADNWRRGRHWPGCLPGVRPGRRQRDGGGCQRCGR